MCSSDLASQHSGARLQEALDIAKRENLPSYIGLQNRYNLLDREPFESDQQAVVVKNNLSVMPFYGLARGFLSGKYRKGITVESVRSAAVAEYQNDRGYKVLESVIELAKYRNSTPAAIALAWLRSNSAVSTPIASARTVEQLHEIVEVIDLSSTEIARLNAVSRA